MFLRNKDLPMYLAHPQAHLLYAYVVRLISSSLLAVT